ncbi:BrnA antitoxin family protein [Pistricoccus aurantiacus]|uniref:BrnA antitoxin family protein n=1 Tax=Pistricoccus aurantiacus TaxID=1883414 RepID=A0A5B8SLY7_9GAMM|nr:BrnA antitoxin family protein [Pistricoccus aurantiacus]QEA38132.1 BrnA antitoxin family protein [Pistricoccus aurantiacus]
MSANKRNIDSSWIDPDDAPELTDEFFEQADEYRGDTLVRRGRHKAGTVKERITVRLDPGVVSAFRETGPGWQTRMNQALRVYLSEHGAHEKEPSR